MLMPGRTLSTEDYRFGFNGQERSDDIKGVGKHNTALFWEYDTRLGKRLNIDPKPNASFSNYAVFNNSPILFTDLLGDTAWDVKNRWDNNFIRQYRNTLSTTINKFREEGKTFTCEDLGLDVLMTFSKENNLPFKWETGDKNFDASSDEYKDFESFSTDVKQYTGARDFARKNNTSTISYESLSRGDVAVLTASGRTNPNHIQLITSLHIDEGVRKGFNVVQGNFNWLGKVGSNNPNSVFYMGVLIQSGYYSKDMDSWTNFTEEEVTTDFLKSHYNVQFRRFNFMNWNNK